MKRGLFFGLIASGVAGVIMLLFRLTLGVLTLPEVLIDWVTSLMPLGLFLLVVETLGGWAKSLLVAALTVVLVAAGGGGGMLWVYNWSPPGEGKYIIKVRAADGQGNLQTSRSSPPLPDGATGYHSVVVKIVKE